MGGTVSISLTWVAASSAASLPAEFVRGSGHAPGRQAHQAGVPVSVFSSRARRTRDLSGRTSLRGGWRARSGCVGCAPGRTGLRRGGRGGCTPASRGARDPGPRPATGWRRGFRPRRPFPDQPLQDGQHPIQMGRSSSMRRRIRPTVSCIGTAHGCRSNPVAFRAGPYVDRYMCGSGCEEWTADSKAVLPRSGPWVASCGFAGPAVGCGTGWGRSGRAGRPAATIRAGTVDGCGRVCVSGAMPRVRAPGPGRGRPAVRRGRAGDAARPASTTVPGPAGRPGRPCPGAGG